MEFRLACLFLLTIATAVYCQIDYENYNSTLPIIVIDTNNQTISKAGKVLASLKVIFNMEGQINNVNDVPSGEGSYDGFCGLKYRGSSSFGFPKKSFTVETWDEDGEDAKSEILGFPEEEDYVLQGPHADKSMIKNHLAYAIQRELVGTYAPRTKFVEVFVKENDTQTKAEQYKGLYAWTEKITRDKNRVDVKKAKDDEADRGYVYKYDKLDPDDVVLATFCVSVAVVYPNDANTLQQTFLKNYIDDMCMALQDMPGNLDWGYEYYLHTKSWQDEFILQQLTGNMDAFHSSNYFSKDKEKRIKAGPLWDIDLGFGHTIAADQWVTNYQAVKWWQYLMNETAFVKELVERWDELRSENVNWSNISAIIDDIVPQIQDIAVREVPDFLTYIASLKTWIQSRLTWMDQNMDSLIPSCTPECTNYECGWDGCGNECGTCSSGNICVGHQCMPDCDEEGCDLPPLPLYEDSITNGYTYSNWATLDLSNHEQPRTSQSTKEIKMSCGYGGGFFIFKNTEIPTEMIGLSLWVHGGNNSNVLLYVKINDQEFNISSQIRKGEWRRATVQFPEGPLPKGLYIQCYTPASDFYIDQIEWVTYINTCADVVCNDNNACTADTCVDGACIFTPSVQCNTSNDNACQENVCNPSTGACELEYTDCDDGNLCTTDSCDAVTGCSNVDSSSCSSTTDACESSVCNPSTGLCEDDDVDCDDGNACTADSCDSIVGCINTEINCESDLCTTYTCDQSEGCVVDTEANCNDADPCTTDSCDPETGCVNTPISGCGGGGLACSGRYQCSGTTVDYNFVDCIGGHCTCLDSFDGSGTTSDKCRCDKAGVKWGNGIPFCLANGQCVGDYNGFGCSSGTCSNIVNGVGTC